MRKAGLKEETNVASIRMAPGTAKEGVATVLVEKSNDKGGYIYIKLRNYYSRK